MCFLTHFLLHLMKCLSLSHIAITLLTRPMAILNVVHIFLFYFFLSTHSSGYVVIVLKSTLK